MTEKEKEEKEKKTTKKQEPPKKVYSLWYRPSMSTKTLACEMFTLGPHVCNFSALVPKHYGREKGIRTLQVYRAGASLILAIIPVYVVSSCYI